MSRHFFVDREDAACQLLPFLNRYRGDAATVILGLPRGGVVIAERLARALSLPLDVVVIKKVNPPHNEEFAVGAVAEDGESFFDWTSGEEICGPQRSFEIAVAKKRKEALARAARYRAVLPMRDLHGKTAILVDDGIATGASMRVAVRAAKKRGAKTIVIAIPVAPRDSLVPLHAEVDGIACPRILDSFTAVGECYAAFPQIEDKEVVDILKRYSTRKA